MCVPMSVRSSSERRQIISWCLVSAISTSPHCKIHIQALERVETFTARVVTHNWKMDRSSLLASLQWSSLESRRKTQSLKVCFNNNLSIIPPSYFSFHPHPSPRRPHNLILYEPFARTNSYFFSFFVNVVSLWNQLPNHVVSSFSSSAFKHQLSSIYL